MLTTLRITDIILIEQAHITFKPGFNVITGETGAGKSAILRALALVLGERSDTQALRKGAEKGAVEASFDSSYPETLVQTLESAGIVYSLQEPLILRREISSSGKSRAFVNNQLAQISLLKAIGSHLIDIVNHSSNYTLRDTDTHREMLDMFGETDVERRLFAEGWKKYRQYTRELNELIEGEAKRLRQLEAFAYQLKEIQEADLKEEEEDLFQEYSRLTNIDELRQYVESTYQILQGESLPLLSRQNSSLAKAVAIDSSLKESVESFQNAICELQEVAYTLRDYLSTIESDPSRVAFLSSRLATLAKIKKKYGPTLADVSLYRERLLSDIDLLAHTDERIVELKELSREISLEVDRLAKNLSEKRKMAATHLADHLKEQLRSLNMPYVHFQIGVSPTTRSSLGDDHVEFFFTPNLGEKMVSVCQCASGGEISRLLLALQALMAGKHEKTLLVFDEVDANIGGETATVVGKKLSDIGKQLQLLCITHFPQVAKHAHHHLRIKKQELQGRTFTQVDILQGTTKAQELKRMVGG